MARADFIDALAARRIEVVQVEEYRTRLPELREESSEAEGRPGS